MDEKKQSIFETLYKVNLKDKISKKMNLSYVSWADIWAELKKCYPDASYKVYTRTIKTVEEIKDSDNVIKNETENEVLYFTDGHSCHVKVGVTIDGVECIEYLPVMDNRNQSISVSLVKSTDVNKAIQRALVKACARHGLGLYIYESSGKSSPA